MKKVKFLPLLVLTLLELVSCKKNIEAQNPDIQLSEEHAKMLNLIFNIRSDYADWCIDFDTSSDNYYIIAEYSDIDNQKLSDMKIYRLQYCNGIISDMTEYKYIASDGLTSKTDSMKIRWDDSKITVTSSHAECSFSLENPDALILSSGKQAYYLPLGYGIKKLEDGVYHFLPSKTYSNTDDDFLENRGETILFAEDDGKEYLAFSSREKSYSLSTDVAAIAKGLGLPYKLYINGRLSFDVTGYHSYNFDGDKIKQGFGTYSYISITDNYEKFKKNKIDNLEIEASEIFRDYDENGHLIYEKRIPDKSLYEGTRSGTVRMITKAIPDIKEFDKSLRQQISIKGARYGTH